MGIKKFFDAAGKKARAAQEKAINPETMKKAADVGETVANAGKAAGTAGKAIGGAALGATTGAGKAVASGVKGAANAAGDAIEKNMVEQSKKPSTGSSFLDFLLPAGVPETEGTKPQAEKIAAAKKPARKGPPKKST